jgi:predicted MPP superfamily phosphohydrolase
VLVVSLVTGGRAVPVYVGTEDSVTKHYDLRTALQGLPATPVRVHLSHAPEVFDWTRGPAVSFALCLAGHTHGGQIRFPLPPAVRV